MAIYLPMMAVLLVGGDAQKIIFSVSIATVTVAVIPLIALRFGRQISKFFLHDSDEIVLLSIFGAVILVGGLAQRLQVSAAVGAFLVGIALSGPIAEKSDDCSPRFVICLPRRFSSFSGCKLTPKRCPA